MNNELSTHAHKRSIAGGGWRLTLASTAFSLAIASLIGCGGSSNSEVHPGSGGASGGGTGGASMSGGSGGSTTGGGTGGGTAMGSGGVTGGGADGGVAGACPAQAAFALAVHVILDATWAAGTATNKGSGQIHLWNRAKFSANGLQLTGETASCGSVLPPFTLNGVGSLAAGGSMVAIDVPNSVWDTPTIPKFPNSGAISGWDPGSTINITPTIALVGLTMPDPMAAWPASYTAITTVDADGDGKAGFTAIPRQGGGFVAPPLQVTLFGLGPAADQVYLATRTVVQLDGKMDTCTAQSGMVTVKFFDSHVVGCHVKGAGECTPAQTDFVDTSRTNYTISGGTFTSKQVADDATCANVRDALPM